MDIDSLTVGEVKSIQGLLGPRKSAKTRKSITDGKIRIVVLQRGWVYVGRYFQDGEDCRLENASCIRIWGTSKGLNELVNGPVSGKTSLDPTPLPVRFHELTACFTLDCPEDKWATHLK